MTPSDPPPRGSIVAATEGYIRLAADVLRRGGLVAVPTETVYGLAASARDLAAVAGIFAAKGRPADHPLIVHLAADAELDGWAAHVPAEAAALAEACWPGPLTLVLERHRSVPTLVTGGRDTVAVRKPAHPVAQQVLEAFGDGLAAPSANRFGRVSPTLPTDVAADLGAAIDLVLDGGRCDVGVESTIVAIEDSAVRVLRPGGFPPEAIAEIVGREVDVAPGGPSRAPGMLPSHYAPATPVVLHEPDEAPERVAELAATGKRVGVLAHDPLGLGLDLDLTFTWDAGGDVERFAHSLYRWLRQADQADLDVLVVVPPPPTGLGLAVRDRLRRAATSA